MKGDTSMDKVRTLVVTYQQSKAPITFLVSLKELTT